MYHFIKSALGAHSESTRSPGSSSKRNGGSRLSPPSDTSPTGGMGYSPENASASSHHAVLSPAPRASSSSPWSKKNHNDASWKEGGTYTSPGGRKTSSRPMHSGKPYLRRSMTMPDDGYSSVDIKRTGSGSLLMRKKTFEEQEEISRARAQKLSVLFEQSDIRDMELNKNANVKYKAKEITGSPSLKLMSIKEAEEAYAKNKEEHKKKAAERKDPLLTPSELKAKKRLEEQQRRKKELKERAKSEGNTPPSLTRTPSKQKDFSNTVLQQEGVGQSVSSSFRGQSLAAVSPEMTYATDKDGNPLYSSGLLAKKTPHERKQIACVRAEQLSVEMELSGDYDRKLNKGGMKVIRKAKEVTAPPKIGMTMTPQEAAARFKAKHSAAAASAAPQKQDQCRDHVSPVQPVGKSSCSGKSGNGRTPVSPFIAIGNSPQKNHGKKGKKPVVHDLPTLC